MTEKKYKVICAVCDYRFEMLAPPELRDGATMDCPECGTLLLGMKDGSTVDFHAHLSDESDGLWPADGSETEVMIIFDGKTKGGMYNG